MARFHWSEIICFFFFFPVLFGGEIMTWNFETGRILLIDSSRTQFLVGGFNCHPSETYPQPSNWIPFPQGLELKKNEATTEVYLKITIIITYRLKHQKHIPWKFKNYIPWKWMVGWVGWFISFLAKWSYTSQTWIVSGILRGHFPYFSPPFGGICNRMAKVATNFAQIMAELSQFWILVLIDRSRFTPFFGITLPETNSLPLKMYGWKTSFLLEWPIFRGHVSFGEGNWWFAQLFFSSPRLDWRKIHWDSASRFVGLHFLGEHIFHNETPSLNASGVLRKHQAFSKQILVRVIGASYILLYRILIIMVKPIIFH